MIDASGTALELRRRLPATPDAVFRACTDPGRIARWMTPIGVARAQVDLRVGGEFTIVMAGDGIEIEHRGEYLEIDPPHRLRFTWQSPYTGPDASEVTIDLHPAGAETDLILTHRRLPPGAAESHAGGWGRMLDRLAVEVAPKESR